MKLVEISTRETSSASYQNVDYRLGNIQQTPTNNYCVIMSTSIQSEKLLLFLHSIYLIASLGNSRRAMNCYYLSLSIFFRRPWGVKCWMLLVCKLTSTPKYAPYNKLLFYGFFQQKAVSVIIIQTNSNKV